MVNINLKLNCFVCLQFQYNKGHFSTDSGIMKLQWGAITITILLWNICAQKGQTPITPFEVNKKPT